MLALLSEVYQTPRGANAFIFIGGLAAFCGALWIARRLPHDDGALASEGSLMKPAGWIALSTILTTCMLLLGAGMTSGDLYRSMGG